MKLYSESYEPGAVSSVIIIYPLSIKTVLITAMHWRQSEGHAIGTSCMPRGLVIQGDSKENEEATVRMILNLVPCMKWRTNDRTCCGCTCHLSYAEGASSFDVGSGGETDLRTSVSHIPALDFLFKQGVGGLPKTRPSLRVTRFSKALLSPHVCFWESLHSPWWFC